MYAKKEKYYSAAVIAAQQLFHFHELVSWLYLWMLQPRPGVAALSEKAKFSVAPAPAAPIGSSRWGSDWHCLICGKNHLATLTWLLVEDGDFVFLTEAPNTSDYSPIPNSKFVRPNWHHFWFSKTDLTWRWWQHFCQNHRRHDSLLQSLWNRGPRSRICSSCGWLNACDCNFERDMKYYFDTVRTRWLSWMHSQKQRGILCWFQRGRPERKSKHVREKVQ